MSHLWLNSVLWCATLTVHEIQHNEQVNAQIFFIILYIQGICALHGVQFKMQHFECTLFIICFFVFFSAI